MPGGDASDLVFLAAERSSTLPVTITLETFMVWVGVPWSECRNRIRVTPFEDEVFHSFKEAGHKLYNFVKLSGADVCTVVSTFDQVDVHSVSRVNHQL